MNTTYTLANGKTVEAAFKSFKADGGVHWHVTIDGVEYRDAFTMDANSVFICNKTGRVIDTKSNLGLVEYIVALPKTKMGGAIQFFFPEFPNHPLNGMYAYGCGAWVGEIDGKMARRDIFGLYDQYGHVPVTTENFRADRVLVKEWFGGEVEYFYLVK